MKADSTSSADRPTSTSAGGAPVVGGRGLAFLMTTRLRSLNSPTIVGLVKVTVPKNMSAFFSRFFSIFSNSFLSAERVFLKGPERSRAISSVLILTIRFFLALPRMFFVSAASKQPGSGSLTPSPMPPEPASFGFARWSEMCSSSAMKAGRSRPSLSLGELLHRSLYSDCTRAIENSAVISPLSRQKEASSFSCSVTACHAVDCSWPPVIDCA